MNPELLEQRKDTLLYNQNKNDLIANLCEPLKTYFNVEWFTRAVFVLNTKEECVGYQVLTTNVDFFKSYLFQFNDNGKSFTQAIKETPPNSYSYFLWSNEDNCPLVQLKYHHGLTKGFVIYKRLKDHIEVWSFAEKNLKRIPNIITQASVSFFHDFVDYFDKQKTLNQLASPFVNYPRPFDMSYISSDLDQLKDFKTPSVQTNLF